MYSRSDGTYAAYALGLHAKDVHDVGVGQRVDRVADRRAERLDPARKECRGRDEHRFGADEQKRLDERPGDTRVEDVADDRDGDAVKPAESVPNRVEVEEGLRRVLVLPVSGVDDVRVRRAGDQLGRTDVRRRITITSGS